MLAMLVDTECFSYICYCYSYYCHAVVIIIIIITVMSCTCLYSIFFKQGKLNISYWKKKFC